MTQYSDTRPAVRRPLERNLPPLSVVGGGDSILVKHLIEHYRALGVESFKLIRHAESTADPDYEPVSYYAHEAGVELYDTWLGPWDDREQPWDDREHERRMASVMAAFPRDWFVIVDLEEFHLYDRPIRELTGMCESGGYKFVRGCYIDRLAADGGFPEIDAGRLWEQYPLGGAITAQLLDATALKVGFALGGTLIGGGHHVGLGHKGPPRDCAYIQVHHFKWTGTLLERTRRRIQRYESGAWPLACDKVLADARRLVEHVDAHGGRLDLSDPRFCIGEAGSRYGDHPRWADIVGVAGRWEQEDACSH